MRTHRTPVTATEKPLNGNGHGEALSVEPLRYMVDRLLERARVATELANRLEKFLDEKIS